MAKILLVTGFHRSGTSMTAHYLQNAGLGLGEDLLPPGDSNPYGHFEDSDVVRFHERLLKNRGLTWQAARPFLAHITPSQWDWMSRYAVRRQAEPLWGFKDPRLCLFLHPWKRVVPEARVLYVHRPAAESLYSLKRRSARALMAGQGGAEVHARFWENLDLAARSYVCYARMFLTAARNYPGHVAFISREAIIDGFDLPGALNDLWDLGLQAADIEEVYDPSITDDAGGRTFVTEPGILESVREVTEQIERQLLERSL